MNTLVIWDVDGTLTDSRKVISDAYRHAARVNGLPVPTYEVLEGYMCGGLRMHMDMLFGDLGDVTFNLMRAFREYREAHATDEGLFEGILETLEALRDAGVAQAVATMKLESLAADQLRLLGISDFFTHVAGDSLEGGVSKADMIRSCAATGTYDRVIMVGDCPGDRAAAEEAGVEFVAAAFGYGYSAEVCESEGIAYVTHPTDLLSFI